MIALIVGSEMIVIVGGVLAALHCCYDWKTLSRNRLRAYRFSKEVSRLNDREHVDWAAHLVATGRKAH